MVSKFYSHKNKKLVLDADNNSKHSIIYVNNTNERELQELSTGLDLDFVDIVDVLDDSEISRIEIKNSKLFLYLRNPVNAKQWGIHTLTLLIVITKDNFVIITQSTTHSINDFLSEGVSIKNKIELINNVLENINRAYWNSIKHLKNKVTKQKLDAENINNNDLISLVEISETFDQYHSALIFMNNSIHKLINGHFKLTEDEIELLIDRANDFHQLIEICKINLKSIQSVRDSYQIIFTNNLNRKIHYLTLLTIMITVPTTVSSIYGMNIRLPFSDEPYAFILILMISIAVSIVIYLILKIKKWI